MSKLEEVWIYDDKKSRMIRSEKIVVEGRFDAL